MCHVFISPVNRKIVLLLRRAVLADRMVLEKVQRICRPHVQDPYAQRCHFWMHYAEEHLPVA